VQGGGAYQEVLERNLDALALLLGIDSPSQERNLPRKRMDWNIGEELLDEALAPGADLGGVGAVDSVYQLDQRNGGQCRLLIAGQTKDLLE
jgi:hypothetical protein